MIQENNVQTVWCTYQTLFLLPHWVTGFERSVQEALIGWSCCVTDFTDSSLKGCNQEAVWLRSVLRFYLYCTSTALFVWYFNIFIYLCIFTSSSTLLFVLYFNTVLAFLFMWHLAIWRQENKTFYFKLKKASVSGQGTCLGMAVNPDSTTWK